MDERPERERPDYGIVAGVAIIVAVVGYFAIGALGSRQYDAYSFPAQIASNPTPASTEANSGAHYGDWHTVDSWSGNGLKETEPFTIHDERWKVIWSYQSDGPTVFAIYEDGSGSDVLANEQGTHNSGESNVYGAGTYHLTINTTASHWNVKVLEQD